MGRKRATADEVAASRERPLGALFFFGRRRNWWRRKRRIFLLCTLCNPARGGLPAAARGVQRGAVRCAPSLRDAMRRAANRVREHNAPERAALSARACLSGGLHARVRGDGGGGAGGGARALSDLERSGGGVAAGEGLPHPRGAHHHSQRVVITRAPAGGRHLLLRVRSTPRGQSVTRRPHGTDRPPARHHMAGGQFARPPPEPQRRLRCDWSDPRGDAPAAPLRSRGGGALAEGWEAVPWRQVGWRRMLSER